MTKNGVILKERTRLKVSRPNSVFSGENTYTTLFLMPAFDCFMDTGRYKYFINSYIDDIGIKHCFKRPLFVLVKYEAHTEGLLELTNYLRGNKYFVYTYLAGTTDNALLRMFVFECPPKYKSDYDAFLQAKYSKFSDQYKTKFNPSFRSVTGVAVESPLYGVVYKTETLKRKVEGFIGQKLDKEQEYFGILTPEFEIFRYE